MDQKKICIKTEKYNLFTLLFLYVDLYTLLLR